MLVLASLPIRVVNLSRAGNPRRYALSASDPPALNGVLETNGVPLDSWVGVASGIGRNDLTNSRLLLVVGEKVIRAVIDRCV
jgi:hypothetical protein